MCRGCYDYRQAIYSWFGIRRYARRNEQSDPLVLSGLGLLIRIDLLLDAQEVMKVGLEIFHAD